MVKRERERESSRPRRSSTLLEAGLAGKSDEESESVDVLDSLESSESFNSFSFRSIRAVSMSNGGIRYNKTSSWTSGSRSRIENLLIQTFLPISLGSSLRQLEILRRLATFDHLLKLGELGELSGIAGVEPIGEFENRRQKHRSRLLIAVTIMQKIAKQIEQLARLHSVEMDRGGSTLLSIFRGSGRSGRGGRLCIVGLE